MVRTCTGAVVTRMAFHGVKVFSSSLYKERSPICDMVTQWMTDNPGLSVVDHQVRQSSDCDHHCFTIVLFFLDRSAL